jgi:hypothetical protein
LFRNKRFYGRETGSRLFVEREILTEEEFWEMVRVVDQERKGREKGR